MYRRPRAETGAYVKFHTSLWKVKTNGHCFVSSEFIKWVRIYGKIHKRGLPFSITNELGEGLPLWSSG